MSRDWKPGTAAMVTWSALGVPRTDMRFYLYRRGLGKHVWESPDGTWIGDSSAKDVRPLVVIDPEDREQVERLSKAVDGAREPQYLGLVPPSTERMQDALRSLIEPPKPEEPTGHGAVVEDAEGVTWVRVASGRAGWVRTNKMFGYGRESDWQRAYADIDAVRVLSEGVQP